MWLVSAGASRYSSGESTRVVLLHYGRSARADLRDSGALAGAVHACAAVAAGSAISAFCRVPRESDGIRTLRRIAGQRLAARSGTVSEFDHPRMLIAIHDCVDDECARSCNAAETEPCRSADKSVE